ncbi:MAG: 3-hydroxybutyryl-CoA dehydratase [Chloroflexi bacterium AL-W]|nr:3-hydroxybutyryl-CoA dehydratase [Chloroflexi bacterium AL-N1]NOK64653.1 3-hydroxybutyryl-CoA dehydratase [Chloroflexi bacterium AL-N10]NOK75894.1 3-hydroxybutyryl-CoA dehydratase [Chloroflexi bacterium AL-N5]NOK80347.1 3-hydroxybutyryl-CoA dehydratase [Chloroflexi bacterium AL-W]NOK86860.1 3-hydroxybutyryl-CoA dehydratase [Chloroflexi bacterium AL-N15]
MTYTNILFERDGAIATITINRERVRNALNQATIGEILTALREVEEDDALRVAVITGAGDKAFIAGADISEVRELSSATDARVMGERGHQVGLYIAQMHKIVMASINGFALGGGLELAMGCDIRIAADTAKFGQPEINLGIIPGWGGTQRLTRLVGSGMSKLLNLTGDMISADEALRIGLVEQTYPVEELSNATRELAQKIASKAPVAVTAIKQAINRGMDMSLVDGCMHEAALFGNVVMTEDAKEGTSAFLEKRAPNWTGR